jgi:hypothetical protein
VRAIRTAIVVALTDLGIAILVAAVLIIPTTGSGLRPHLTLVLIGVVLIEVAGWKHSNPFLPNERRYHALREEVDGFVALVRRLNRSSATPALAGEETERAQVVASMHTAVDRMVRAAGRERREEEGDER